jgi:hypothetical protein
MKREPHKKQRSAQTQSLLVVRCCKQSTWSWSLSLSPIPIPTTYNPHLTNIA